MDVARFEIRRGGQDESFLEGGIETDDDYGLGEGVGLRQHHYGDKQGDDDADTDFSGSVAGWHFEHGGGVQRCWLGWPPVFARQVVLGEWREELDWLEIGA